MQLLEIGTLNPVQAFSNYDPFVFTIQPGLHDTATYWTTVFLAADETNTDKVFISGFVRGAFNNYTEVSSIANCVATEKSFYWDNPNQLLYVHLEHDQATDSDSYSYETFNGYTDSELIYIDDQEYLPLIESLPSVRQSQDLINYDKLAFITGTTTLNNNGGELDFYKDLNVYGNNVFNSYLDPDDIIEIAPNVLSAARSDIQRLQSFYVEDYGFKISSVDFKLQDLRKAGNIDIPIDRYNTTDYPDIEETYIDKIINLAYGEIREINCTPIDGNLLTHVTFKAAIEMSSFGTIQINIDGIWTTKTSIGSTLSTGEFVLLSTDARDSNGKIRECKLVDCIGIANTYSSDIIVDLNERFVNETFNSTFYDTTEWDNEKLSLKSIGIVYNTTIKLFEAIRLIQNGSNIGFRYEFNSQGKKTIRIDREDRELTGVLHNTSFDRYNLPIDTDSDNVFSKVRVEYAKSFNDSSLLSVLNDDFKNEVGNNYRQLQTLTRPTFLTNQSDAEEKALLDATIFKDIPKIVSLTINTPTKIDRELFLKLRIFDIIKVELTPAEFINIMEQEIFGREYFGIQAVKIISINPNPNENQNKITGKLIENYTERIHFDFTRVGTDQSHFNFTRVGSDQKHFDFTRDE